jgi:hypothetical protein
MNLMVTALIRRERRVKPGGRATLDTPPRYVRFALGYVPQYQFKRLLQGLKG